MLVESIVRETLGLKDHRVVAVHHEGTWLTVDLDRCKRRWLPCSVCGRRCRVRDQLRRRCWNHVPLWGMPVVLAYAPCRVQCPTCGIHVEWVPWAQGKCRLSLPLVVMLATWSRLLPWDTVARLFGVSWATVVRAVKQAVAYGQAHRDEGHVLYIGVDEISRRRGHIYHTQVYDLQRGRLLWSGPGRDADALRRFFQWWGERRAGRIRGVCCDMWSPYVDMIREAAPQATLVFDKFHVVRHLLEAVNEVRKAEARELQQTHPGLLVNTRYIWLKNPWNLTGKQADRLGDLERLNLKINRAYLLKETFRELWTYQRRGWAKRFLERWLWWASHSRLKPMCKFARMVREHIDGILAWFDVPINNGRTEALNNTAKAISHRARGFRTAEAFTLAQLHCMGGLPLPQTVHRFW